MAKFKSNHSRGRGRGSGSNFSRIFLLVFVAIGLLVLMWVLVRKNYFASIDIFSDTETYQVPQSGDDPGTRFFLPESKGEIVHHKHYSLAYLEKYEIAAWVAYELTRESIYVPNVPRTNWFNEDPSVSSRSADYYDYKGSGYTRGHLAPAGDMAFSKEAMEESFLMSNISPQLKAFNNGIWKELEENVRDWAVENKRLYVVSGPLIDNFGKRIGKNKVHVPASFYKILLDTDDPELKAIAFIIPNKKSSKPLADYATSIDEVERKTGIDFFPSLLSDKLETELESTYDISKWPLSEKRYKLRIEKWNNQ